MPRLLLLICLVGMAVPCFAVKRVTVEKLERVLAADQGKTDAKIAKQLSSFELLERLSPERESALGKTLPGPQSRQSLLLLADGGEFLSPPPTEVIGVAAPDPASQRRILLLASEYVKKTIAGLPNFFSIRNTLRFEDVPGDLMGILPIPPEPMHQVSSATDTVFYQNGREVVAGMTAADTISKDKSTNGLKTVGIFGPVLETVLLDVEHGTLSWDHWEKDAMGDEAVFHYVVPASQSHYKVALSGVLYRCPGYHGIIAVNPRSGTVLRLIIDADTNRDDMVARSAVMVDYGPVEIGSRTYTCPLKSVSIRSTALTYFNRPGKRVLQTALNDVTFEQYHQFRTEVHILAVSPPPAMQK